MKMYNIFNTVYELTCELVSHLILANLLANLITKFGRNRPYPTTSEAT